MEAVGRYFVLVCVGVVLALGVHALIHSTGDLRTQCDVFMQGEY